MDRIPEISRKPTESTPSLKDTADQLSSGITTRVLAQRLSNVSEVLTKDEVLTSLQEYALAKVREKSLSEEFDTSGIIEGSTGSLIHERSNRFLRGSSIPNSTILTDFKTERPTVKDAATLRQERNEYVANLMERLEPNKASILTKEQKEQQDYENLLSIRKRLERESLTDEQSKSMEELNRLLREKESKEAQETLRRQSSGQNEWTDLKERRRASRRTSTLAPIDGARRSTYETIRKSIDNSRLIKQLIDANKLEEEKMKVVRIREKDKTLSTPTVTKVPHAEFRKYVTSAGVEHVTTTRLIKRNDGETLIKKIPVTTGKVR